VQLGKKAVSLFCCAMEVYGTLYFQEQDKQFAVISIINQVPVGDS
jgi:hypothetical protein